MYKDLVVSERESRLQGEGEQELLMAKNSMVREMRKAETVLGIVQESN